jgi:hypothetical protein
MSSRLEAGPAGEGEVEPGVGFFQRPRRGRDRAVVLGEALERFPRQVQTVEIRIDAFEAGHEPQRMGVVVEPAGVGHGTLERVLAAMPERRVAKVVGKAQRLGQILVEAEYARDGAADLRDLDRMGQADPEMIAVGGDEHLRLVAQAAEGDRVNDPVAVALEGITRSTRGAVRFGETPAARS